MHQTNPSYYHASSGARVIKLGKEPKQDFIDLRKKVVTAGLKKFIRENLAKKGISGTELETQVQKKVEQTTADFMTSKGDFFAGNIGMVKSGSGYLQTGANGEQYYEFGIGGENSSLDLDGDGKKDSRRYIKVSLDFVEEQNQSRQEITDFPPLSPSAPREKDLSLAKKASPEMIDSPKVIDQDQVSTPKRGYGYDDDPPPPTLESRIQAQKYAHLNPFPEEQNIEEDHEPASPSDISLDNPYYKQLLEMQAQSDPDQSYWAEGILASYDRGDSTLTQSPEGFDMTQYEDGLRAIADDGHYLQLRQLELGTAIVVVSDGVNERELRLGDEKSGTAEINEVPLAYKKALHDVHFKSFTSQHHFSPERAEAMYKLKETSYGSILSFPFKHVEIVPGFGPQQSIELPEMMML